MADVWVKLEGHVVDGVYPLLRYLGGSKHSVAFLTHSAAGGGKRALKLIPAVPSVAPVQLARWREWADLSHPHLMRVFDVGECHIGGRHFLYTVMDYAGENLAQLLRQRALTEDEAREMLAPTLDALAFLHEKDLVQGKLQPSNVLVVDDQIRLASDTIRVVTEGGHTRSALSAYMPPEASEGTRSPASDVWALGVTLCEALTRQKPSNLHAGELVLPPDLPPDFRGVVTRCLSRRASERPTVKELQAWTRGAQLVASRRAASRDQEPAPAFSPGLAVLVIIGTIVLFVMGWAAIRFS